MDIKQRVIWGSTCDAPAGAGLAFGGQDQQADDGRPHTRIRQNGRWVAIHQELRAKNPLQGHRDLFWALRKLQKNLTARARSIYFQGLSPEAERRLLRELAAGQEYVGKDLRAYAAALKKDRDASDS